MTKRTEKLNCVAMKDHIQAEIMAEYEARKDEFASFAEFLRATPSRWERDVRQTLRARTKRQ